MQIRNLNFYYGKLHALHSINLQVAANRVTALIGPSGCGKSTLIRTFNRMHETVRGTRLVIDMVTGESIIHNDPADAWSAKAAPENDASGKGFVVQGPVIGGRPLRAVLRHIVPNAIGTIIVQATFAVADAILTLSVLGFLTLGVAPPATDWGIPSTSMVEMPRVAPFGFRTSIS